VGVLDCGGTHGSRPATIVVACGDGGYQLTEISWEQWTDEKAVGTAQEGTNNCVPSCAEGTFEYRQVSVTLSGPRALRDGSGGYFTWAVVSGSGGEEPRVLPLPEEPAGASVGLG
jgi:hypothetical protein